MTKKTPIVAILHCNYCCDVIHDVVIAVDTLSCFQDVFFFVVYILNYCYYICSFVYMLACPFLHFLCVCFVALTFAYVPLTFQTIESF